MLKKGISNILTKSLCRKFVCLQALKFIFKVEKIRGTVVSNNPSVIGIIHLQTKHCAWNQEYRIFLFRIIPN